SKSQAQSPAQKPPVNTPDPKQKQAENQTKAKQEQAQLDLQKKTQQETQQAIKKEEHRQQIHEHMANLDSHSWAIEMKLGALGDLMQTYSLHMKSSMDVGT